jgi:hypothetical protein
MAWGIYGGLYFGLDASSHGLLGEETLYIDIEDLV